MNEDQVIDLMKQIETLAQREQFVLLSKVDEERRQLLGVLMQYLGSSPSRDVRAAAAYLIGRHRLSEGAPALVESIGLDARYPPMKGPEPLWERYPAMEALINIGKPAVRPCIGLLATEDDHVRRYLAIKVVRYVEGPQISEFVLKQAQAIEGDSAKRARLEDALVQLRHLPR
ncbi:MAG: HEAT repeat domain-containing protein [Caldilineaceae bacterium]